MNKRISIIASILAIILSAFFTQTINAQSLGTRFSIGDFSYAIDKEHEGEVSLVAWYPKSIDPREGLTISVLQIPGQVTYEDKTYKVTSMYRAFFNIMPTIEIGRLECPPSLTKFYMMSFNTPQSSMWGTEKGLSIGTLYIPGAATFDNSAFYQFTGLKNIDMPRVVSIGNGAFYQCSSLTSAVIPTSTKEVGAKAFQGCKSLKSVQIKGNPQLGDELFSGCESLTDVKLPSDFCYYPKGMFKGCSALKKFAFPNMSLTFDEFSFSGTGFTELNFDQRVTLKRDAFSFCKDLKSVTSNNTMSVNLWSFGSCENLTSIDIQYLIMDYYYAFTGCPNIKTIKLHNLVGPCVYGLAEIESFSDEVYENTKLHIPKGSKVDYCCPIVEGYKDMKEWSKFKYIIDDLPNASLAKNIYCKDITVRELETVEIPYYGTPLNADIRPEFSVDDETVAKIDGNKIIGHSVGTCKLRIHDTYSGLTKDGIKVTVLPPKKNSGVVGRYTLTADVTFLGTDTDAFKQYFTDKFDIRVWPNYKYGEYDADSKEYEVTGFPYMGGKYLRLDCNDEITEAIIENGSYAYLNADSLCLVELTFFELEQLGYLECYEKLSNGQMSQKVYNQLREESSRNNVKFDDEGNIRFRDFCYFASDIVGYDYYGHPKASDKVKFIVVYSNVIARRFVYDGIDDIIFKENSDDDLIKGGEVIVYDMLGRNLGESIWNDDIFKKFSKGIYIIRQGEKVKTIHIS